MRIKSLTHLYGSFSRRSSSLAIKRSTPFPVDPVERDSCEPIHQDGVSFLVVRLQTLWAEFCRELILRSAIGGCATRTIQSLPAASNVKIVKDVQTIVETQSPKGKFVGFGARWEEPTYAIQQAQKLRVANFQNISLGLGSAATDCTNLKVVRNFIVHPNQHTRGRYDQMALVLGFYGLAPSELVNQRPQGGPTIFDYWVMNLENAARNAVH